MKRKLLLSVFLATSLLAKTELSLNLGTNSFAGDEKLNSATSLGIRGDFYLDNLYHIDLGYDDLGSVKVKDTTSSLKIQRVYTQFSADGEEEYHVVPTMSVGAGYENQKGDLSDSQPFVSVGVGFRYNVSNSFNFLLGTKALWKTSSRDVNFHTTFGVGYLIGEEPVNNTHEIEEVTIPKEKVNIKTEFSPKEVEQIVQVPTEIAIANDSKIITVQNQVPQVVAVKTVQVPVTNTNVVRQSVQRGYFIQVAAYSQNQPTSLLTRLSRSGNHVVLRHNGSITKALVGPYSSEESARVALGKVKRVARGAFLVK